MKLNFNKYPDLLVPAVIQDHLTSKVLMLGFMNEEALKQSLETGKVCFFSRSKQRLWVKGEESGNFLYLKSIEADCDNDTLLIKVEPVGPVCHTGADTCWNEENINENFLPLLEDVIENRKNKPDENSYISNLYSKGINKIAQKLGEEAVEMVIEAKDHNDDLFLNEAADLLFHYLILLKAKGFSLKDVQKILESRHKK